MITGMVLFYLLPAVALGDSVVKTLYIDGMLVGEYDKVLNVWTSTNDFI
jgi:hypothetical protein